MIVLDTRRIKNNKTYPVKLRVTFERKQKYFPTKYSLTQNEFDKIMSNQKLSEKEKEKKYKIYDYDEKAKSIIDQLPIFTWTQFEKLYYTDRAAKEYLENAFAEYVNLLKAEDRYGTASSYECSIRSLKLFQPGLKFRDVTVDFLKKYESWMLMNDKSISTVGIYLRPLRAIFNKSISDGHLSKDYYPFGKNRYEIPTSKNIKKALSSNQIKAILAYVPTKGSNEEKYRDYWAFIYLCNGMNVKDMCLLRYKNINGDMLEYVRAKTVRTKRTIEPINVYLLQEAKDIVERWGNKKENGDTFIFPELGEGLSKEKERKLIQQVTKVINKTMKSIAEKLGILNNVTTYVARHSYASTMRRFGKSDEFIGEQLGHGSMRSTKSYLASFGIDEKIEATKALISFSTIN